MPPMAPLSANCILLPVTLPEKVQFSTVPSFIPTMPPTRGLFTKLEVTEPMTFRLLMVAPALREFTMPPRFGVLLPGTFSPLIV